MGRLSLVVLVLFIFVGLKTFADDDRTPNVCSTQNAQVCAHLGHASGMKSDEEAQFIVHLEIPTDAVARDVAVQLWMPDMGHGSSPVTLTALGANHFRVTEAYFVMAGTWEVQVSFKITEQSYQLNIPVQIVE